MANVAWVDVETTGLDVEMDYLLEVGITITTPGPIWAVVKELSVVYPFKKSEFDEVNLHPAVLEMHKTNGLWDECEAMMETPFDSLAVQDMMIQFLHDNDAAGSPMYGNTVHFDRAWLKQELPALERVFHYRNFDVSTLKQYAIVIHGENYPWMDREIHRGCPDNQDAIANLTHFRNRFR